MDVIWLITPQHTATHFCRCFLECHPEISFWLQGNTPYADLQLYQLRYLYCLQHLSGEKFRGIIGKMAPIHGLWTVKTLRLQGVRPNPKLNPPRYRLIHSHGDEMLLPGSSADFSGFKMAVSMRDPLKCITTALRRTNMGEIVATRLLDIMSQLFSKPWYEQAFKFCIDLWERTDPNKCFDALTWLGLTPDDACREYVKRWPRINETTVRVENVQTDMAQPVASTEEVEERRRIKDMLARGELHPVLEPWVEELRRRKFQPYFEALGYRNLLWYE